MGNKLEKSFDEKLVKIPNIYVKLDLHKTETSTAQIVDGKSSLFSNFRQKQTRERKSALKTVCMKHGLHDMIQVHMKTPASVSSLFVFKTSSKIQASFRLEFL